jgi:predicted Zn-dependent protease
MQPLRTAHYLDGRNATRHNVVLRVTPAALHIVTETGETKSWPYDRIRQTQGSYAGEPVRLEYGEEPSETVVVSSTDLLQDIHRVAPSLARHLHNPIRRKARLRCTVIAAGAVFVLTAVLYKWGIPGFAAAATPYIPTSWENALGREVVGQLVPTERQCRDPERTAKLARVVQALSSTAPSSPYPITLYVVDSPSINAFAAPGGHVVLFRGLLERTENPEQLAGVLAHELQHVYRRHTTRAILEQTASTFFMTAFVGDFSGVAWGLQGARTLGALHYSRSHETEADMEGLRMLQAANLDPGAMIAFYGILQQTTKDHREALDFLATHPNIAERIATLLPLTGPRPRPVSTLLPNDDWNDIRTLCRMEHRKPETSS